MFAFFTFLKDSGLDPVFIQGYYMPSIVDLYRKWKVEMRSFDSVVIRLHGPNRQAIETKTKSDWSAVLEPRDSELAEIVKMIQELGLAGVDLCVNVNNHYEGSAPLTIERLRSKLAEAERRRQD